MVRVGYGAENRTVGSLSISLPCVFHPEQPGNDCSFTLDKTGGQSWEEFKKLVVTKVGISFGNKRHF